MVVDTPSTSFSTISIRVRGRISISISIDKYPKRENEAGCLLSSFFLNYSKGQSQARLVQKGQGLDGGHQEQDAQYESSGTGVSWLRTPRR